MTKRAATPTANPLPLLGNSQMNKAKHIRHATPSEVLVAGFAAMIAIGSAVLMSPAATKGAVLSLPDALFTATSAVCVTGLSVFDPGTTLSMFGQITLLILIQCGGLGFMTLTAAISKAARHRTSLHNRVVLRDSISASQLHGLGKTVGRILTITAVCEATGAILLMTRFVPHFGATYGVYYSIFHAISSFCNAGFDVFGHGDNMIPFANDPVINGVTMALVIIGGLGFFVIMELADKVQGARRHRKLTLHTRIVLTLSTTLTILGAVLFLAAEWDNPLTLGRPENTAGDRVLGAFFQSVSTRTAGFVTVPQDDLRPISRVATVILMFIGASPAGTGGGLKTTTTAVVAAFLWSVLQGRKDVVVFKRRIPTNIVYRAAAMFALGIVAVVIVACTITVLEPEADVSSIIFETTSAFGTAGLPIGITSTLCDASLVVLAVTMFGGRVGFFTLTLALAYRLADHESHVAYPEEKIVIG